MASISSAPSAPLGIRDPDEFGIEISFAPQTDAPSRIFRAMTELIEAFQEIDTFLAHSIRSTLQPTTLLENIEVGSLRVWLRNALESVDDEALKSGEWKKVIGGFLVRAKRIMISWTDERTTVTSAAELDELRQRILDEAASTDILSVPFYRPIPAVDLARSLELISGAMEPLGENDIVRYLSSDPPIEISQAFTVVPETLTRLLVKETLESETQMILMIKRPDFLGDARWEFRHGKQAIEAKLQDAAWMTEFRNGIVPLQPGDALRAMVCSTVRYGYDGDVVDSGHIVTKAMEVIHAIRPSQGNLFRPPIGPPDPTPAP